MNKIISKKVFIEKLKFYLLFYFDDSESISILHDYEEWFMNESLQGKTEEEICFSLGSPKKVINKLLVESEKSRLRINILLQNTVIQTFLLLVIHFLFSTFLLKTCNRNSSNYFYFALGIVFVYFIIEIIWIKRGYPCKFHFNQSTFYKVNLFVFGFTIVIILFQVYFFPNIKFTNSGKICFFVLSIFVLCLFLLDIYFVVKKLFQTKQFAFLTTLHILGVTTILFYTMNQLNMLYDDISQCSNLIYGSGGIYLETVILCCIFYIQNYKRKLI